MSSASEKRLPEPTVTVLGEDPTNRRCRINCYAFQQDAIVSFNGWQYAAFYSHLQSAPDDKAVYVHLARRELHISPWEVLVFDGYPQTVDDGHNTVQLGICPEDGTIHLAYDHHCDVLRYRYSSRSVASNPSSYQWNSSLFTPTLDYLPGLPSSHKPFHYVTYPRFAFRKDDMFFSLRDGKAGLGNDHLYLYSGEEGRYSYVGQHLTGIQSNPYVHGIDPEWDGRRLHTTWVYRGFVHYEGWDDLNDTKHKQQAGPNGAENNHNICYAYSDDRGQTWKNGEGKQIADLKKGETVDNSSEGIVAFEIPKGSGLINQEAQAIDQEGGVHVLNRDNVDSDGKLWWKHYYRSPEGVWRQSALRPVHGSTRGRLAVDSTSLFFILPNSETTKMCILKSTRASSYQDYQEVWSAKGFSGEPLVDPRRLNYDATLSVMVLSNVEGQEGKRNVVVLDFDTHLI